MVNSRNIARLGMLAVGLGIGAAVASTPGVARADDFQISIDGMDLFPTVGNTAAAYSGTGDIAIAWGNGAIASAEGGTGDYALADGSGAEALAGGISTDTGADDDTAIDIGTNASTYDGADAGNSDLAEGTDGGTGSGDTAIDIGNNSSTEFSGAFAGAGGLIGESGSGNNDTAIDIGTNTPKYDGAFAVNGNDNHASGSGDNSDANAGSGNDNTAEVDGSNSAAAADQGDSNTAEVVGPNSIAVAGSSGDNDASYVFDPFGTHGSEAFSGEGGNFDLSAVFGDDLESDHALGLNLLYDFLSPAGDLPGTAAATSGGFLGELLALF
jgi:hypothetical protein